MRDLPEDPAGKLCDHISMRPVGRALSTDQCMRLSTCWRFRCDAVEGWTTGDTDPGQSAMKVLTMFVDRNASGIQPAKFLVLLIRTRAPRRSCQHSDCYATPCITSCEIGRAAREPSAFECISLLLQGGDQCARCGIKRCLSGQAISKACPPSSSPKPAANETGQAAIK